MKIKQPINERLAAVLDLNRSYKEKVKEDHLETTRSIQAKIDEARQQSQLNNTDIATATKPRKEEGNQSIFKATKEERMASKLRHVGLKIKPRNPKK
ncbi:hypothetical protein EYV94_03755 [Puteibacter caeruleilacunae]|nr:hypothetical protein EYV94_03755 [Puteibacter caeruleilacunae]